MALLVNKDAAYRKGMLWSHSLAVSRRAILGTLKALGELRPSLYLLRVPISRAALLTRFATRAAQSRVYIYLVRVSRHFRLGRGTNRCVGDNISVDPSLRPMPKLLNSVPISICKSYHFSVFVTGDLSQWDLSPACPCSPPLPCCCQTSMPPAHRPMPAPPLLLPVPQAPSSPPSRPCPLQGSPDEPTGACTPFATADAQMRQLHHGSLAHVLPSHAALPSLPVPLTGFSQLPIQCLLPPPPPAAAATGTRPTPPRCLHACLPCCSYQFPSAIGGHCDAMHHLGCVL